MSLDANSAFVGSTVAILAGGLATRLKPLTEKFPKALIPIKGKPFLEYQIELLKKQKLTNILICTGYEGHKIEDYFKNGSSWGVQISYSYDGKKLLGTGGALKKALPLLSPTFIVIYGDSYLDTFYRPIFDHFTQKKEELQGDQHIGLMTVFKNNDRFDKSNIIFKDGAIVRYDKKNKSAEMNYIDWGLGILTKEVFDSFPTEEVFDLADLYQNLVNAKRLLGYEVPTRFYEIGSFEGLREIEKII